MDTGKHQVSAILGREAFDAAADPSKFPEQLKWVKPWQAKRVMQGSVYSAGWRTGRVRWCSWRFRRKRPGRRSAAGSDGQSAGG